MVIAEWLASNNRRIVLAFIGALALCIFFLYIPIQRNRVLSQIELGISEQAWPEVASDLRRFWDLVEGSAQNELWFQQALMDLPSIHTPNIDISAQIMLIQWLLDHGAVGAARTLLEQHIIYIEAGTFIMGSEIGKRDELPSKKVSLSTYAIDRFEVTHLQYRDFLREEQETPPRYWLEDNYPGAMHLYPVVGVSWDQAQRYCQSVGKRLPTEAEWERACRGDQGSVYPWGDDWLASNANLGLSWSHTWPHLFDDAWRLLDSKLEEGLQPVGRNPLAISPHGISDLIGNAAEWVFDWYNWEGYSGLTDHDPVNLDPPWNHVVRGNGWFSRQGWERSIADDSRCSARSSSHSYDDPRIGFRCALDMAP